MFENFEKLDKSNWIAKASEELGGKNPLEELKWCCGGVEMFPYYDKNDLDFNNLSSFDSDIGVLKAKRSWKNIQRVKIDDRIKNNHEAIEALENGADGIQFFFANPNQNHINFNQLFQKIPLDKYPINFSNASTQLTLDFIHKVSDYYSKDILEGMIAIDPKENNYLEKLFDTIPDFPNIQFLVISSCKESIIEQISDILFESNKLIGLMISFGIDLKVAFKTIALNLDIGLDFFGELAKIKSVRNLFFQLAKAYGHDEFLPKDLKINCTSRVWNLSDYQPKANVLKGTTAALSSILGGCNSLVVLPENNESNTIRISRNISLLLKEEASLSEHIDPVAGSYFIDSLIDNMSKKAWINFQSKF